MGPITGFLGFCGPFCFFGAFRDVVFTDTLSLAPLDRTSVERADNKSPAGEGEDAAVLADDVSLAGEGEDAAVLVNNVSSAGEDVVANVSSAGE